MISNLFYKLRGMEVNNLGKNHVKDLKANLSNISDPDDISDSSDSE